MEDKTAIVIVNFNAGDHLLTCIRSIFESHGVTPMVVIVDNASNDGSLEKCREAYSKLTYIVNSHNIGFAAAANSGARYALERHAQTVVFLNPDATLHRQCLAQLSAAVSDEGIGIAAPMIYRMQDRSVWYSAGEILWDRQRAVHRASVPASGEIYDTQYATGCVMAVKAEVFLHAGLLDEDFFLYYEDVDFSLRVRKSGKRVVVVPHATAWHREDSEQNKPQKTYFLVLSGLLFFYKHTTGYKRIQMHILFILRRIKADIRGLYAGDDITKSVKQAFKDYNNGKKITKNHRFFPHR